MSAFSLEADTRPRPNDVGFGPQTVNHARMGTGLEG
jgi:hypothetical protein